MIYSIRFNPFNRYYEILLSMPEVEHMLIIAKFRTENEANQWMDENGEVEVA